MVVYICQFKSLLDQSSEDSFARKTKRIDTNFIKKTCVKRDVTEQHATLVRLLRQKNHYIRRLVQNLDKQAYRLIGWTHNSSVTKNKREFHLKGRVLESKYDPVRMNTVAVLDFPIVFLVNSLLKAVQIRQKIMH